jgi:hypothetical protein
MPKIGSDCDIQPLFRLPQSAKLPLSRRGRIRSRPLGDFCPPNRERWINGMSLIKPVGGQRQQVYVEKGGDSGFDVQGQFSDGHTISGNVGYVTTRHFPPVEIVVQDDGSVIGKQ